MVAKNMEVKKAGAMERAKSSAVNRTEAAKPTIKVKNGGGMGGGMAGSLSAGAKALARQSEGRDR